MGETALNATSYATTESAFLKSGSAMVRRTAIQVKMKKPVVAVPLAQQGLVSAIVDNRHQRDAFAMTNAVRWEIVAMIFVPFAPN